MAKKQINLVHMERSVAIQRMLHEERTKMKKNKKKQKHKKDKVRPVIPAKKPDASHMPVCSTHDCKRHVSDARKTKCAQCGSTTLYSDYSNMYGMYE